MMQLHRSLARKWTPPSACRGCIAVEAELTDVGRAAGGNSSNTSSLFSPPKPLYSEPMSLFAGQRILARWNSSKAADPIPSKSDAAKASPDSKSQPDSPVKPSTAPASSSGIFAKVRDALLKSASKAASRNGTGSGSEETVAPPTYPDMKRLFSLAGPERKTLVFGLCLLLVSASISLLVPFAIGKVIDFFTSSQDEKGGEKTIFGLGFKSVAALMVFVFATGAAARAGSSIMLNLAGVRIVQAIRQRCFGNAVKQEVEWADKSHGDVISRLSVDTSIVGDAVTYELGDGLRAGLTVLFSGTTMFLISPALTLLMMAVVPPAAIGAVFYGRYLRDLTNKVQEAVGQMTRTAEERLNSQAFRTVTAFNAQRSEQRRFDEKVNSIAKLETKETYATGFFYAGTGFVGNCSILVLLTYGGTLVSRGVITVGDLTSLLMYTAYLGGGLANLTSFFASLMKGVGAGARVFQLVDRESEIKLDQGRDLTEAEKRSARIEFKNVHFEYPSRPGVKVLDGVDLTIERGESVALVGGSGVGKSSVHSLLLRYYDPTHGSITYGGAPITDILPAALRDQLAVVTQDPILFAGTVFDNIAYGSDPTPSRQQVEEAAKMANCWEFIEQLPKGLDTEIGARQLSGGQRQRVAIARALCRRPKVLLLDEATSALDAASEHLVNQSISEIIRKGDITVWIVAHRLSTIRSAQRIVVLKGGKIVESGSFEALDKPGSAFRQLIGSQIERDDEGASEVVEDVEQQQREIPSSVSAASPSGRRSLHTSARQRQSNSGEKARDEQLHFVSSGPASISSSSCRHPAIPSKPTWSVTSLLSSASEDEGFTTAQLAHLHKLCALEMPTDPEEVQKLKDEMRETKRLIDVVRRTPKLDLREDEEGTVGLVDGRVRDEMRHEYEEMDQEVERQEVKIDEEEGTRILSTDEALKGAKRTRRGFFVVEKGAGGAKEEE
ncbi:hypothetical protein BDZ90DRAFT_273637 [Jaminaea rosea]|uniref:P-loop containing nucleoside triphosphate hydrolase protein n=1 Tax=Jaminaea rosea TaxID=1569628 RepID=A0A316UWT5_9BASI|nr:hypothetical protein BDZ90DRAFT_273637 [Jaminaea rosea]PWN29770.1 hypothetical protein BDZ90DRAFT_273637 [Jaminaea rosea]